MRTPNPYISLVRLLSNILDAHTVAFFVADSKGQHLNLVAAESLSQHLKKNVSLPLEESGILSQVHKSGQSLHMDKLAVQDIETTLPFYRGAESYIKGVFITPVGGDSGLLFVDTKVNWGFNDKQRKWISEIAALLNELLHHEQRLVREQNYARILKLWHQLDQMAFSEFSPDKYFPATLAQCSRFLDVDYGFLALTEGAGDRYRVIATTDNVPQSFCERSFSMEEGLVGWVFHDQKSLLIRRLKPQVERHFLFFPKEKFPHQGTFWGIYNEIPVGHAMVLGFLSTHTRQWNLDEQYAIERVAPFTSLILERVMLNQTCDRLQNFDACTGIYNALAFESLVEEQIAESLQNGVSSTLVVLQFDPWESLYTQFSPNRVREYWQNLVHGIIRIFPSDPITAQLAENRLALLYKGIPAQQIENSLQRLKGSWKKQPPGREKAFPLKLRSSLVTIPRDGSTGEELWGSAYRQLLQADLAQEEALQ
jgi:GGDEF domain-containing protein